jgi:FkbM family methyltransferase
MLRYFLLVLFRTFSNYFPKIALRIANALRIRPLTNRFFKRKMEVFYFGARFYVDCEEWIGFFTYVGRCYECVVLDFFRRIAGNYRVFFDIGANLGIHSLVFAKANSHAQVFGFEPIPDLYSKFYKNIKLNSEISNVTPLCLGIADETGLFPFDLKMDDRSRGEASLICNSEVPDASKMWVSCLSFKDLSLKFNVWPDFVKIDVEGAEALLLEGLKKMVEDGRPAPDMIIEVHGWMFTPNENIHSQKVMTLLRQMNYFIWHLIEDDSEIIIQEHGKIPFKTVPVHESEGIPGRAMLLVSRDRNRFGSSKK